MTTLPKDEDHMSTATTLLPEPQVRTTLTGRPITYQHDNFTNMMSDGSFGDGRQGANLLPPGYTDSSLVHIPIKVGEYLNSDNSASIEDSAKDSADNDDPIKRAQPRRRSALSRLAKTLSGSSDGKGKKGDDGELRIVDMSRGEYLKYWAKGEDGKFREDVVEPPGGRAEWLREKLEGQAGKADGEEKK